MSRLEITSPNQAQLMIEELYKDLERRIESSPPGLCPVDMTRAFVEMCHTHTCGKCVPCRVGLWQLKNLLTDVMNGEATMETLKLMEELSQSIMNGADCAIGYEAAHTVYRSLKDCREDYEEHVHQGRCTCNYTQPVPCVSLCPAHVDIPGYVSLVREGRYADAIRLIRKDNPFPTTCGFICEHPCEARCRRNIIDDAVNIRGLKRFAADYAGKVPPPACAASTGKKIAIIGGGPGGLSAAYYLQLMGHQTTVFEMLPKLGGMLRYGIPNYRLPKERLDDDINAILETGVKVEYGKRIGTDITIQELRKEYDAVLITIGASTDKKLGIEGESAEGVISAVRFLRDVGKNLNPDLSGQEVAVIGGGIFFKSSQQIFEFQTFAQGIGFRGIEPLCSGLFVIQLQFAVGLDRCQRLAQICQILMLDQGFPDTFFRDFFHMGINIIQRTVLHHQCLCGFLPHLRHSWNIIGGISHQGFQFDKL